MAALVLVAGLAFGVPALMKSSKGGAVSGAKADGAGTGVTGLQVSNAPDLSKDGGSFLNGYKETWRYSESTAAMPHFYTLLADAGDVLVVNDSYVRPGNPQDVEEPSGLIGISKQTGKRLWKGRLTGGGAAECAPNPFGQGKWIVCSFGQYSGTDTLETIDPKTGREGPRLSGLGPDSQLDGFAVVDDALYIQRHSFDQMVDPDSAETFKFTDPTTIAWQVTSTSDAAKQNWLWATDSRSEGPLVYVGNSVLEANSGSVVEAGANGSRPALLPGPSLVRMGSGGVVVERTSLPDGTSFCSVTTPGAPMLATSAMAPIVSTGTAGAVIGFDPEKCTQTWQANLPFEPVRSAWNGGDIAVVTGRDGVVAGVKVSDGTVLWQSTLPIDAESLADDGDVAADRIRGMVLLDDGTLLVGSMSHWVSDTKRVESTLAFDSTTGSQVWRAPVGLTGGVDEYGVLAGSSFQTGFLIAQENQAIVRWDPADEWSWDSPAANLPTGIPSCPEGLSPLTFSRYSDGAILVCGSKKNSFAVVAQDPAGKSLDASSLSFAGRSCEVGLAGGKTVRLSLGGAWVQSVDGSSTAQYAASEAWDYRAGSTTFSTETMTSASDVKQCPAGSWPVALQTWEGGWLLVCGTSADEPTLLAYSDKDAGQGEATTVGAEQGGYCGETTDGRACGYAAPATVRLPGAGGVQRTAVASSFDRQGVGAQNGQTGADGVTAPDGTAKD